MPEVICRECGATNDAGASECWLCHRRDWRSDGSSPSAKPAATPGADPSRRRIALAIVTGAVVILGLGMLLDIRDRSDFWGLGLVLATLAIPLGLMLWARARGRPHRGPSPTNRELAAAGATIAAGVILLAWLVQAVGPESIGHIAWILTCLAVPAGLITWARARHRLREGRPMSGLQLTASMIFLAVLLPPLLLASLMISLFVICVATGQMNMH
jgi:hypothetical protein